jgi:hypothetical protein
MWLTRFQARSSVSTKMKFGRKRSWAAAGCAGFAWVAAGDVQPATATTAATRTPTTARARAERSARTQACYLGSLMRFCWASSRAVTVILAPGLRPGRTPPQPGKPGDTGAVHLFGSAVFSASRRPFVTARATGAPVRSISPRVCPSVYVFLHVLAVEFAHGHPVDRRHCHQHHIRMSYGAGSRLR